MTRPKSAGEVQGFGKLEEAIIPEPMASPTKGILMTPGTAAAKRKTVTFGEHVLDNADKRPSKSGIPDDCPGKFPSPWAKPSAAEDKEEEATEKGRGRSKLTEALEQAREESAKRKRSDKATHGDDSIRDLAESKSDSGMYWKTQYDVYRENSQREVKKLIAKQKMAKSFAKDKDFQCTELADQLRLEKKKVEMLEKRTAELEARLKEMQATLTNRHALEQKPEPKPEPQAAASKPDLGTRRSYKSEPAKAAATTAALHSQPQSNQTSKETQSQQQNAEPAEQPKAEPEAQKVRHQHAEPAEQPQTEPESQKARRRARPDTARTRTNDDIWNQSLGPSSPVVIRTAERPLVSPNAGRTVTSGTTLTPLKSLSINTLPTGKLTRRDSAQPSPPHEKVATEPITRQETMPSTKADGRFSKESLIRQEVLPLPKLEEERKDSAVLPPGLPQPSPEQYPKARRDVFTSPVQRKATVSDATEDLSIPVPASSPFDPNPVLSPPVGETKRSYFDRKEETVRKPTGSPPAKENISPPTTTKHEQTEIAKPMAAWNAINAPAAGKRIVSLTDKSGKEVGVDRIEAAKARLAARRRNAS